MPETSSWTWTLVVSIRGQQYTQPGRTIAPADASQDTILPGILADLEKQAGRNYRVISFSATKTN